MVKNLLTRYKDNMIREAETKAKYYEALANTAVKYMQPAMASHFYRKARIQYHILKGLLTK